MRILIVEDEKDISDFLKKGMESECFVVDVAEDGEKGSFLARTNDYDLIILDNILPKKDGLQVCREIRLIKKTVPILMLSVRSETDAKVSLLNAGADDYLAKPFSFDELLARVRALLRRSHPIKEEIFKVCDFSIDRKRYLVNRSGKEIYLTRKEFTLLEFLLKNEGIVLSRGKILENVWGAGADFLSNTLESHIFSLRRKLGLNKRKKIIQTVPGRGYKIEACC